MKSSYRTTVFLLLLISVGYFATDIYLPSLPILRTFFHSSEGETQLTMTSYLISFAFAPLFLGPISDFYGRKKVILLGLGIAILATILCYFSESMKTLIVARFFQGIGTGAVLISSRAMVRDLFTGRELAKQISFISMIMPLVLSLAPALGGFLQESFGWQSVFLFLIIYLAAIFLGMLFSKETLQNRNSRKISHAFTGYKEVLKNRGFINAALGLVIPTIGIFAYLTASPFLFQEIIGLSPSAYGDLALYIGIAIMISSFLNAKLLRIISIETLILIGSTIMAFSGLIMMVLHLLGIMNTLSILLPTVFYFCCLPFCIGNAASIAMSQIKSNFGVANGLMTTSQFLAGALGALFFSLIPDKNANYLAMCYLILGIGSVTNTLLLKKRKIIFN